MTTQREGEARFETLAQELYTFIEGYADLFKSQTHSYVEKAKQYVSGLFQAEKSNMEKMSETSDSGYIAVTQNGKYSTLVSRQTVLNAIVKTLVEKKQEA